jgi:hypothetical protein
MLATPEPIRTLQRKLYNKAKNKSQPAASMPYMTRFIGWTSSVMPTILSEPIKGALE